MVEAYNGLLSAGLTRQEIEKLVMRNPAILDTDPTNFKEIVSFLRQNCGISKVFNYLHTYIQKKLFAYIHFYISNFTHANKHAYVQYTYCTYIHTYIHIYTYIHTYIDTNI